MLNIDYKKWKIILIRIECKKRGFIYEILYIIYVVYLNKIYCTSLGNHHNMCVFVYIYIYTHTLASSHTLCSCDEAFFVEK